MEGVNGWGPGDRRCRPRARGEAEDHVPTLLWCGERRWHRRAAPRRCGGAAAPAPRPGASRNAGCACCGCAHEVLCGWGSAAPLGMCSRCRKGPICGRCSWPVGAFGIQCCRCRGFLGPEEPRPEGHHQQEPLIGPPGGLFRAPSRARPRSRSPRGKGGAGSSSGVGSRVDEAPEDLFRVPSRGENEPDEIKAQYRNERDTDEVKAGGKGAGTRADTAARPL